MAIAVCGLLAGCGAPADCTRTVTGDAAAMRQAASDIAACERAAREAEAAAARAQQEAAQRAAQAATAAAYVPPTAIVPPTPVPPTPTPTATPAPVAPLVIVPTVVVYVTVNAPGPAVQVSPTAEAQPEQRQPAVDMAVGVLAIAVVMCAIWLATREKTITLPGRGKRP